MNYTPSSREEELRGLYVWRASLEYRLRQPETTAAQKKELQYEIVRATRAIEDTIWEESPGPIIV